MSTSTSHIEENLSSLERTAFKNAQGFFICPSCNKDNSYDEKGNLHVRGQANTENNFFRVMYAHNKGDLPKDYFCSMTCYTNFIPSYGAYSNACQRIHKKNLF